MRRTSRKTIIELFCTRQEPPLGISKQPRWFSKLKSLGKYRPWLQRESARSSRGVMQPHPQQGIQLHPCQSRAPDTVSPISASLQQSAPSHPRLGKKPSKERASPPKFSVKDTRRVHERDAQRIKASEKSAELLVLTGSSVMPTLQPMRLIWPPMIEGAYPLRVRLQSPCTSRLHSPHPRPSLRKRSARQLASVYPGATSRSPQTQRHRPYMSKASEGRYHLGSLKATNRDLSQ